VTDIAYLVHDLHDAAVTRRVTMLRAAGARVTVIGFRRGSRVPIDVAGAGVVDLGRTHDARLLHRAASVGRHLLLARRLRAAVRGADVVIARNVETLALAARVRPKGARLIYECLDIHRTLLGSGPHHRLLQRAEARLLRGIDLLIVSSPAFLRDYFVPRGALTAPSLLLENKLLVLNSEAPAPAPARAAGPPWTIAWFGMLRCRRTFDLLTALAERQQGRVRILIAGKPSPAVFPDFQGLLRGKRHVDYVGPYRPADLAGLYGQAHFAWAIDYFEEGLNSSWLLPNRLYEALAHGAVPIALASVETGRWLAVHGAGLLLDDAAPADALATRLQALDAADYAAQQSAVAAIPREAVIADIGDCVQLLQAVAG